MSDASTQPGPPRVGPELIVAIVVIALAAAAMWFFAGQRQQQLRPSAIGFKGLEVWLRSQGEETRAQIGVWEIERASVGLLVLPIFDTDIFHDLTPPTTKEELLFQQDEYDLEYGPLRRKRDAVRTLLIMPKWRSGTRLAGAAHPFLLVDREKVRLNLRRTTLNAAQDVSVIPRPFTDFNYRATDGADLTARLYLAQVFSGVGCTPIIGTPNAMVLGECRNDNDPPFLVLSDPDLFNNHGLRLGDNARIAADFMGQQAKGKSIIIDYEPSYWLFDAIEFERPERTWADILQFFAYPFSLLWIGLGAALVLAIWRAGVRFGPIRAERTGPGRAKLQAIAARAKMMRLTGKNGPMLADYAAARVAALATAKLGPAYGRDEAGALHHFARLSPEKTDRLKTLLDRARALRPKLAPAEAIAFVDEFETHLSEIEHDT